MELDLFVAGSDKVVDDVRRGSVATGTAEPFAAGQTSHNAAGIVDSTVAEILSAMKCHNMESFHTRKHEGAILSLLQPSRLASCRWRRRQHSPGFPGRLPRHFQIRHHHAGVFWDLWRG